MGIDGIEELTGADPVEQPVVRETDQEIKDRQDAEKAAARDEHNRRVGGGQYANQ